MILPPGISAASSPAAAQIGELLPPGCTAQGTVAALPFSVTTLWLLRTTAGPGFPGALGDENFRASHSEPRLAVDLCLRGSFAHRCFGLWTRWVPPLPWRHSPGLTGSFHALLCFVLN